MKITKLSIATAISILAIACGPAGKDAETSEAKIIATNTIGDTYSVDLNNSVVNWVGSKMSGDHTGTINISEGKFQVVQNEVKAGTFTFDMNSIKNTDMDGEWAAKLEGHLKAEDFFHVDSFPTATFEISEITTVDSNPKANTKISGNLTIKDITKSISFDALLMVSNDTIKMNAPAFIIDRTEWNVKYGSAKIAGIVKDKAISDDMAISFNIVAAK